MAIMLSGRAVPTAASKLAYGPLAHPEAPTQNLYCVGKEGCSQKNRHQRSHELQRRYQVPSPLGRAAKKRAIAAFCLPMVSPVAPRRR
jgi:hypothetical protein